MPPPDPDSPPTVVAPPAAATTRGGETPAAGAGADHSIPEWVGRYRILSRLGRGGMGDVFLALDTALGREVAIKVPRIPAGGPAAWAGRFYREARVAAAFTHPDLCPVYDAEELDGVPYLTMPVVPGVSLADRLRDAGRFDPTEAARLTARVADALQVAHESGVVHRDLKPANIMLRPPADDPIVMDFGLALLEAEGSSRLTAAGAYLGTPAYSPPEQLAGDQDAVGPAADVYSLGVIFYQLLTSHLPYAGGWLELGPQIHAGAFAPPSATPGVPARFDAVCRRALHPSPAGRFPDMAAFAAAIRGEAPPANRERQPPDSARPNPRPKLVRAAAITALAVALAVGVWAAVRPPRAVENPAAPVKPVVADVPDPPEPAAFAAGEFWAGTFRFRPAAAGGEPGFGGTVSLRITARDGAAFRGVYRSEDKYEWAVAGTAAGDRLAWTFVKAVIDAPNANVVGNCRCEAAVKDGRLVGTFTHDGMHMTADMLLDRTATRPPAEIPRRP